MSELVVSKEVHIESVKRRTGRPHNSSRTVGTIADLPTPGPPLIHIIPFPEPSPFLQN